MMAHSGVFTTGLLGPWPSPFELRKNLAYGKNATLEKLPQLFCMFLYYIHIFYNHSVKYYVQICRKITKIIATRCQILRLKCTKFDFGWGSAPYPAGGAYSAPQNPYLAGFNGSYFYNIRGREGKGREGRGGDGKGGERRGRGRWEGIGPHF